MQRVPPAHDACFTLSSHPHQAPTSLVEVNSSWTMFTSALLHVLTFVMDEIGTRGFLRDLPNITLHPHYTFAASRLIDPLQCRIKGHNKQTVKGPM